MTSLFIKIDSNTKNTPGGIRTPDNIGPKPIALSTELQVRLIIVSFIENIVNKKKHTTSPKLHL